MKRFFALILALLLAVSALPMSIIAEELPTGNIMPTDGKLRRPVNNEMPMWIVHIDTWNYADPQKIIDLIPEDIKPFVVFNISMSVSYDHDTHTWGLVNDGYELSKSWLRTCAENQVWAMIRPASGGQCHFPDYYQGESLEGTLFEEFFKEYPNFLGFNYCEQFWGFDQPDFPTTYQQRYLHFANLLELTNKYGGYLVNSWCGNQWGQALNPIGVLKDIPEWKEACEKYAANYILCEKHTQTSYKHDMESNTWGTWLSGYSGNFGLRYDDTAWQGHMEYAVSTNLAASLERFALNGATVFDGPELIWQDDFYEAKTETDEEGYESRRWAMYDQFVNSCIDFFRKIIDGTIRIPTREEVIARTKVILIQDVEKGNDDTKYCTYPTLFKGLYQQDGNLRDNLSFYKETGRYPTVPVAVGLADDVAKQFEVVLNYTELGKRWGNKIENKVAEFNNYFPEEYTGDIYAGRYENNWVVYNPHNTPGELASGTIPFKYNTAESMSFTLTEYTSGIVQEYGDSLYMYLSNYNENSQLRKYQDIITITGLTEEPVVEMTDRAIKAIKPKATTEYKDGTLTITLEHNGPVELNITNCKGSATGRLTEFKDGKIVTPDAPGVYYGTKQYEAELFDRKGVERVVTNGCRTGVDNFKGQGYTIFGNAKGAAVRDTVTSLEKGTYELGIRYAVTEGDVSGLAVYVNGRKAGNLTLTKTSSTSDWQEVKLNVNLKEGENTVEIKAAKDLAGKVYLDCMELYTVKLGNGGGAGWLLWVGIGVVAVAVVTVVIVLTKKKKA